MNIRDPNDVREVHGDVVQALDAALHAMLPGAAVNHAAGSRLRRPGA